MSKLGRRGLCRLSIVVAGTLGRSYLHSLGRARDREAQRGKRSDGDTICSRQLPSKSGVIHITFNSLVATDIGLK